MCAISCDPVETHTEWIKDICAYKSIASGDLGFPIIADNDREIVTQLGMLDPDERNAAGLPMPARAVFVVKPNKTLALSILYPATTGRNFDEILRVVDSLQLTANFAVATPANWSHGGSVMVTPGVKAEEQEAKFPKGVETVSVPSGKGYLRITPQPNLPPIEIFDPHFHIWDIRKDEGYADSTTLFAPAGVSS
jgi:1-Cys peroxiredoxin 6